MKTPASLQSLTVVMFTLSVMLLTLDGVIAGLPFFLIASSWVLTALTAGGIYFLFTVIFVVFDNWCCYPEGSSFDDFTLGRCTVRSAAVIHTPGVWHKCTSHSFTRSELIGIAIICCLFLAWLMIFVVRVVLFRVSLSRLCLFRRLAAKIENKTTRHAFLHAVKTASTKIEPPDFRKHSHPILLYRFRFVLIFDPLSILFGYCAVAAKMPAWHVLVQVFLSMIFLACALSYLLVTTSVWMWWILVTVGLAALGLLLLHHVYMSIVMLVFTHAAINEFIDILNQRREPIRQREMDAILHDLQTDAARKAHRDAVSFETTPERHASTWRPALKVKDHNIIFKMWNGTELSRL